jgi:hypothetical protein
MRSDDYMTPATKADINAIIDELKRYTKARESLRRTISDTVMYSILALFNLAAFSFFLFAIIERAKK